MGWFKAGATSIAVGLVVGAIAQVLGNSELALGVSLLFSIIGVVGWGGSFLLWMTARLRARPGSKGPRSMAQRLFAGRFSGWLFRIAGIGLRIEKQNEPPKMERTELTLAAAVGDMFAELPGDMQRRFALVPNVTAQLEADAEALRAREVELSRAIAQVNPEGTGDARERPDALESAGGDGHEVASMRCRSAAVDEPRGGGRRLPLGGGRRLRVGGGSRRRWYHSGQRNGSGSVRRGPTGGVGCRGEGRGRHGGGAR